MGILLKLFRKAKLKGLYLKNFLDNDRCFITDLDENEIQKPRNICQMIRGINKGGVYEMDLEEVRKETYAIEIEKDNVTSTGKFFSEAVISRVHAHFFAKICTYFLKMR